MSISKIQTGDQVKVIAGKFKGTIGQVIKIVKKQAKNGLTQVRAAVSNVPTIANYRRSNVFQGQKYPGLKTETDRLIHVSNLSLLTPDLKPSKVKIEIKDGGKKVRVLKKTGGVVSKQATLNKVEAVSTPEATPSKTKKTSSKAKKSDS